LRDSVIWGTAIAVLLAALQTVQIRREVVAVGREIGRLERILEETRKGNENRALELERAKSPARLLATAAGKGVLPEEAR